MLKRRDILERLIYLDADFISTAYEEIKEVSPKTSFTKMEAVGAEGGLPFLRADLRSQESKTFTLSSIQMLKAIHHDLEAFPKFQPDTFSNDLGSQVAWIEGRLSSGRWKGSNDPEESAYHLFQLTASDGHYSFVSQPEYFLSSIGALLRAPLVLRRNLAFNVRVLGRILYLVEAIPTFVICPYLMLED
jgi:hypothetical protein